MGQSQRPVNLEVTRGNPWYIDNQFEVANISARPTIQRRYHFISGSIAKYMESSREKPLRALDAGCGDGVQLQGFFQFPEMETCGMDYNSVRTERAKEKFPTVNIVCGDLLRIPFKKSSFDIVLCSQVIEHIHQDDLLLQEFAKVIKSEGVLILGTPNEGCLIARLRNYIFERRILKSTDHVHCYKERTIRNKLEAAGFVIQEVMRENWFFPHQRINHYLTNRRWGFRLMAWLSKVIPSQTAGYYFRCVRCS